MTAGESGRKGPIMEIKDVAQIKLGDKGYNGDTDGAYVVTKLGEGWIGTTHQTTGRLAVSLEEAAEQDWRWFRDPAATTTTVAQAVSFAIDEVQEYGTTDGQMGLFLDRDGDPTPEEDLRVVEVSAELENAPNGLMSQFTIKTSDGREWAVRITPAIKPVLGTL